MIIICLQLTRPGRKFCKSGNVVRALRSAAFNRQEPTLARQLHHDDDKGVTSERGHQALVSHQSLSTSTGGNTRHKIKPVSQTIMMATYQNYMPHYMVSWHYGKPPTATTLNIPGKT